MALIQHERIKTTDAKAKELRRFADRLVTLGKQATLAARRRAFAKIGDEKAVGKLFDVIAPRFQARPGGYTRIVKLGIRAGDAAPVSLIEWTTGREDEKKKGGKDKKKRAARDKHKGHSHGPPPAKRAAAG